ncbi:MAG: winged helix-turn-helix domain-containing protein [Solirubrobacterales bacterium]
MRSGIVQEGRGVEERVSYAVGHRIRIEVLAALNERSYSTTELSRIVRQPLSTVTYHVEELLRDGSIEVARVEKVRNVSQNFYRAIRLAYHSDEEHAALPPEARQETYGVILQAIMAESMASFWARSMVEDRRVWLTWCWFNVDQQGREEIADEQAASWARIQEIEARSSERRAHSGEESESIIVASLGFPRSRNSPHPPLPSEES